LSGSVWGERASAVQKFKKEKREVKGNSISEHQVEFNDDAREKTVAR
jgi:hypothetical protein